MAGKIWEFFGYRAEDSSNKALEAANNFTCPIINDSCEKTLSDGMISGVCSIKPMTTDPVICCPIRLYSDGYKILHDISSIAFGEDIKLASGQDAVSFALKNKKPCIAVFGKRWGGELRLPQRSGSGGYFVDWVLAKLDASGELEDFTAVEVQTIDTTGNYRIGISKLKENRNIVKTTAGLNWENVSKRIIPQLIYKGQVLQREEMCKKGIFFVCPGPVFQRIVNRLGGIDKLIRYTLQPASITFMVYDHDLSTEFIEGKITHIKKSICHTTTVYKLQEAFNNVILPSENVYRDAILKALGKG